MKVYRQRTVPYKILAALLYSPKIKTTVLDEGRVKFNSGDLARIVNASNSRLVDGLEWLKTVGIFSQVEYPLRGTIIVSITKPRLFSGETKYKEEVV